MTQGLQGEKKLKNLLAQGLIYTVAVLFASWITPGVIVSGIGGALLFAVVMALCNVTIGVILRIMTLPLNLLTLGLTWGIVNVVLILFVDFLLPQFSSSGFFPAVIFALFLTIIRGIIHTTMNNASKR